MNLSYRASTNLNVYFIAPLQRDKEIQRLREEGFSVASYTGGSPPSSPFGVMSPGGGNSPRSRSPPLGRSYDSVASYEGFRSGFGAGFAEKDEKIVELQEKNIELERKVLDLEDSLRAKGPYIDDVS